MQHVRFLYYGSGDSYHFTIIYYAVNICGRIGYGNNNVNGVLA